MKQAEDQFSLSYVIEVMRKRKWWALTVFSAIFALVLFWTFHSTPVYRSEAKVEIIRNQGSPTSLGRDNTAQVPMTEILNTQVQFLRGRTFMEKVFKRVEAKVEGNEKLKRVFLDEYPKKATDQSILLQTNRLMDRTRIEAGSKDSVITLTADSTDAKLARLISNEMVETYMEENRRRNEDQVASRIKNLELRIEEQYPNVIEAREAVAKYKVEKGIYTMSSKEDEASLERATVELYISELPKASKEVDDALIPLERYKASFDEFKDSLDDEQDDFLTLLPDEIAKSDTKMEYDQLRQKLNDLKRTRGDRHPKVRGTIQQLQIKKEALKKEFGQFVSQLQRTYDLAVEKRNDYQKKIESFERQDETTAQLNELQTKLERATRIYNASMDSLEELGALGTIEGTCSISPMVHAYAPAKPAKPNKPLNIALGLMVALIGGVGMAFFQDRLDNTIKSQDDIEDFLQLPLLGTIPLVKSNNGTGPKREIVVVTEPKSLAAEAFKTVRTGLFFASRNVDLKTMLITSAGPSEGKTMFAVNLALTIAQSGSRTLLIDADIRKPRVHRILQLDNHEGLTDYLSSTGGIIKTQKCAEDPNLYVVTSGPIKPNPTELLGSSRMRNLIDEAKKKFDKIIVDTPPVMTVSDPLILTGIADGIVQVINFGKSNKFFQLKASQKITNFGGRIVGAVLNRVDFDKEGSGYYQNYYYSSSSS